MRLSQKVQTIKVKNIDSTGKTSLLDMINNQIRGTVDGNGDPLHEVHSCCRGGFCGVCKVKVVKGKYVMSDDAIHELCMEEGETLPCSTTILSDEIVIELGM